MCAHEASIIPGMSKCFELCPNSHFTPRTVLGNETAGFRELKFLLRLRRRTCKGVVVGCPQHGLIRAHQHPGSHALALLGSQSDCSVTRRLRVLSWYRCQRCVGGCLLSAEVLGTRGHFSEATTSQQDFLGRGIHPHLPGTDL